MNQLPEGWTTRESRYLWCLVDPEGRDRSFGLTEEIVKSAIDLQPEFYKGDERRITVDKHVEL